MKKAKLFSDNPKKSPMARRKRNPLPVIDLKPKTGKLASIIAMRKQHKNKCKECGVRQRDHGSSRCEECSENHL